MQLQKNRHHCKNKLVHHDLDNLDILAEGNPVAGSLAEGNPVAGSLAADNLVVVEAEGNPVVDIPVEDIHRFDKKLALN